MADRCLWLVIVGECGWSPSDKAASVGRIETYIFDVSSKWNLDESRSSVKFRHSSLRMKSWEFHGIPGIANVTGVCFPASRSPIAFWALKNNSASVSAWRSFEIPTVTWSFRIFRTEITEKGNRWKKDGKGKNGELTWRLPNATNIFTSERDTDTTHVCPVA